jgi:hypothetical protein
LEHDPLLGCLPDRTLEDRRDPLQRVPDIALGIAGLINVKRWLDHQLIAMLEPLGENGQDRRAGVARHPYWTDRESRLPAEEGDRQTVLVEIAISQDPDKLPPLERHHDPTHPTRRHLLEPRSTAGP